MELLLNRYRNKHSVDMDKHIDLELVQNDELLHNDIVVDTIDEFQQYLKEKEASKKYRLTFTIVPICSNVLFNAISEIVHNEGSLDDCIFISGLNDGTDVTLSDVAKYRAYKGLTNNKITRHDAIEDTSYSHENIGKFVYHCGFDIFNNHTLRNKEFAFISKLGSGVEKTDFNTIKDYIRDRNGKQVEDYLIGISLNRLNWSVKSGSVTYTPDLKQSKLRLFNGDTVYSFMESINENLIEKDGWFGFTNPCGVEEKNVILSDISLCVNKCMNNNKACEFIDMYPDRSLYSFIPKVNKFQKRIEPNWECCLTYPYKNYYNDVVRNERFKVNGLKCVMLTSTVDVEFFDSDTQIAFRTDVKHNLSQDDRIGMIIIDRYNNKKRITNLLTVSSIGANGYNGNYTFSLRYDSIEEYFMELGDVENEIRFCKIINGKDCQYYFRVFKRIPNFKNTDVYTDGEVTDSEIEKYCLNGFDSSVNKVAFERTIYNDNVVQAVFNDDVDVNGLRDNLGRELSELYLTIVKNNNGYKEWYEDGRHSGEDITFSHCFGKVTAGLDCPPYVDDYNVHKIHNVRLNEEESESRTLKKNILKDYLNIDVDNVPKNLEEENGEITINGDTMFSDKNGEFLGDIVEFSPYEFEERVIEDVYFRFNTAQRELVDFTVINNSNGSSTVSGEFSNLEYDEINYDDYERIFHNDNTKPFLNRKIFNEAYKISPLGEVLEDKTNGTKLTAGYPANIFPEGYYYKPHYKLKIHEFDENVNTGAHIRVEYDNDFSREIEHMNGFNRFGIKTKTNYYFEPNDTVYLYHRSKDRSKDITTTVYSVSGDNFEKVVINVPSYIRTHEKLKEYNIYRHNTEKPKLAYELNDASGTYIWREFKKELELTTNDELYDSVFTNGAHYFHKNINFFLRRQDPICEYGLSYCDGVASRILRLVVDGKYNDITPYEYFEDEEENTLC